LAFESQYTIDLLGQVSVFYLLVVEELRALRGIVDYFRYLRYVSIRREKMKVDAGLLSADPQHLGQPWSKKVQEGDI
jgi:hypothetical protein